MNLADAFVLAFAIALLVVCARLLELASRIASPSRSEILSRFGGSPARLWGAVAMLTAVDFGLGALALGAFTLPEPLYGLGAHGWALGFTLLAAASLVAVVILTVVRVYARSH